MFAHKTKWLPGVAILYDLQLRELVYECACMRTHVIMRTCTKACVRERRVRGRERERERERGGMF